MLFISFCLLLVHVTRKWQRNSRRIKSKLPKPNGLQLVEVVGKAITAPKKKKSIIFQANNKTNKQ